MYVCTLLWIGLCTVGLDGGPWRKTPDALCRSSHFPMLELLELMLLSIQLLSVQLSSMYSCFQFCGLWHFVECCSQYTIQRCAALNTAFRCISSKMSFRSLESVIQKSHVKLSVGLGPYIHAFIHTWASLGASGGSSEVCQPGLHRNPNIHTYICMYVHLYVLRIT